MIGTGKSILHVTVFLVLGLVPFQSGVCQHGASATASLSSSVSVFGGGSYVSPDYGRSQSGYVFGADYTRYFSHLYVDPSIEVRGLVSPKGQSVGENVFSGGIKVEHAYGRYHPYADFLIGAGVIKYVPYGSDNSMVYTYGGGIDVDIIHHFAVKVDYQGSHWNTGKGVYLTPGSLNFGVLYRIPFRSRYAQ